MNSSSKKRSKNNKVTTARRNEDARDGNSETMIENIDNIDEDEGEDDEAKEDKDDDGDDDDDDDEDDEEIEYATDEGSEDDDEEEEEEESDDSEEEQTRNTTGNVPLEWYGEDEDHIGYDKAGHKLLKGSKLGSNNNNNNNKDSVASEIDKFLASRDDPNYRRSVYDPREDEYTVLADYELNMVRRILAGKFPEPHVDTEPDYIDWYTSPSDIEPMPLSGAPEPKRRFLPSKWERMKIIRIAEGIKQGRIKLSSSASEEELKALQEKREKERFRLLWGEDDMLLSTKEEMETQQDEFLPAFYRKKQQTILNRRGPSHIPAPKVKPPGHSESYHPPPEYLPFPLHAHQVKRDVTADHDQQQQEEEEEEIQESNGKRAEKDNQNKPFTPRDYGILRRVPAYSNFVRERFDRCLDLYLCPRTEKAKLDIDPESLVPKLPHPKELRPFPTTPSIAYLGHIGRVRAVAPDFTGQFLASGGDDGTVRLWEVDTGRCLRIWRVGEPVWSKKFVKDNLRDVDLSDRERNEAAADNKLKIPTVTKLAWNPRYINLLAVAYGKEVHLLFTGLGGNEDDEQHLKNMKDCASLLSGSDNDKQATEHSHAGEEEGEEKEQEGEEDEDEEHDRFTPVPSRVSRVVQNRITHFVEQGATQNAIALANGNIARTKMEFTDDDMRSIIDIAWHSKGEYLATACVTSKVKTGQVHIHHLRRRQSQNPFSGTAKVKGDVQKLAFHPSKPIFFVATKTHVSVYDLKKRERLIRLSAGVKWISSLDIHPETGDHVIIGSYDRRVVWFDLDLSNRPYKVMKYHEQAVREVKFHPRYPLFASASDDGNVNIIHARVFEDLMRSPMLVPVKRLIAHVVQRDGLGVLTCAFHPIHPFIFTAGADGIVRLWV